MNLAKVMTVFRTEEDCLEALEKMRWPEGVRCPTCGCNKICKGERTGSAKNKRTRFYQCLEPTCKGQFSATNGTMFHRSHIPLSLWFMAINIIMDAKKGMSALQLQRHLGLGSYKTAWYMAHRIRKSMEQLSPEPLTGIVEVDETYVGGRVKISKTQKSGRLTKEMVVGIKQRGGDVRYQHVDSLSSSSVSEVIRANVSPEVEAVMTDESTIYPRAIIKAGIDGAKNHTVCHGDGEYVRGIVSTNGVESAFSLFKRGIIGSFHRISPKHLHRYLTEFEYRFNGRTIKTGFEDALANMVRVPHMSYIDLIAQL